VLQRGRAAMQRLEELFQTDPAIVDPLAQAAAGPGEARRDVDRAPSIARGEIEFSRVSFAFPGSPARPVLKDIDFRIPAGATVAIVGRAGAGKTTLLNLLPRLFDVSSGAVRIDGRDVREHSLEKLRRSIAFVPQDPFLFSTTIRANIGFALAAAAPNGAAPANGNGAAPSARDPIRDAAHWAAVERDIEEFPRGFETMVGERGITLSGGQKQRTAIARALIRDPRILVLDDALSSVDTYTEEKILNHLREVMQGRTTVFISHRVSTVRNADRIAVLHGGRIVELGTHDELIARSGYYTDLYNKQLLEEELETV